MRGILLAALALLVGCVTSDVVHCADGRICPAGDRCGAEDQCVSPAQDAACGGLAEGDPCVLGGADGLCRAGACELNVCGDGVKNVGEECDGAALGGETCVGLHFHGEGTGLACAADCTFDTRGCAGACGDGVINGDELCDGAALGDATCLDAGFYVSAGLACSPFCTYDVSECRERCGDGEINGSELCDGSPPLGYCVDFGFDAGPLACAGCGVGFEGCGGFHWREEPVDLGGYLPLTGTGHDDQWTVGLAGQAARFDGTGWAVEPTGTTEDLRAVWSPARGEVWAVGGAGTVRHRSGGVWSGVVAPTSASLIDVWAAAADAVFVIADDGAAYRWDGNTWSDVSAPEPLNSLRGTAVDDLWAIGDFSDVLHRDAVGWTRVVDGTGQPSLFSIAARAPDDVWAVGGVVVPSLIGITRHWDGVTWATVEGGDALGAVCANGPHDVWAASARPAYDFVYHYDGRSWTRSETGSRSIQSLLCLGPGEVVGLVTQAAIRFRGQALDSSQAPSYGATAIWGTTNIDLFVVGFDGAISHFDGEGWLAMTSNTAGDLSGVWGVASDDVFAVGLDGAVYHWDGLVWATSLAAGGSSLHAVWGAAADDVWAVGDNGTIVHYDGQGWTAMPQAPTLSMRALGGTGPADVWAAADGGVLHWNGSAWSPVALGPGLFATLSVQAGDDVTVITESRHALHWNGVSWTDTPLPMTTLPHGAFATARDDLFVFSGSEVVHFDGARWSPVRSPAPGLLLNGMWGTPSAMHFLELGGGVFRLLRTRPWVCRVQETDCDDAVDDDCDGLMDQSDVADCP